jgi:hypothetical protein
LVFSSCLQEKVVPEDFSCLVNGQQWTISNPSILLFRQDYAVVATHRQPTDSQAIHVDTSSLEVSVIPNEGDQEVLGSLDMELTNFHKAGDYSGSDISASGTIVERQGSFSYYYTYDLDKSKPCRIIIEKYDLDSTLRGSVEGIFSFTLKPETVPATPENIVVSYGRFKCPVRVWR